MIARIPAYILTSAYLLYQITAYLHKYQDRLLSTGTVFALGAELRLGEQ